MVIVGGHAGHHQRALRALKQTAARQSILPAILHRLHLGKGAVYQQHPAGLHAQSSSCRVTRLLGIIARSMWFFYPGQTWKFSNVTVNPGPSGDAHINPTCVTAGTR